MRRFEEYHPAVSLVYYLSVILVSTFTANPVVLSFSLFGALLYLLLIDRKKRVLKDFWFYSVLFLLVVCTNPLVSHNGVTPLFFLNGQAVTLESILYGVSLAVTLAAVFSWFGSFNRVFTSDKLLFLLGRFSPKVSVVIASALRFLPLLRRKAGEIRSSGVAVGLYASESWWNRVKAGLSTVSALVTWSLEQAVETGASMNARGFRLKGRTHFSEFRFTGYDLAFLIVVITFDALFFTALGLGKLQFAFYPRIAFERPGLLAFGAYAAYAVLFLLPAVLEIGEHLKWHYYRRKI